MNQRLIAQSGTFVMLGVLDSRLKMSWLVARSLAYELESHWAFDPVTMEKRPGFYVD